ncbi:MAG: hypothetical protein WCA37_10875 [Terracidiphilus sp.]
MMRWLMIALLISLGALLLAAAGMARHIWLHRKAHPEELQPGAMDAFASAQRTDAESEP